MFCPMGLAIRGKPCCPLTLLLVLVRWRVMSRPTHHAMTEHSVTPPAARSPVLADPVAAMAQRLPSTDRKSLKTLNLSSNELDGAAIRSSGPHLAALSSLETLDLSCNRLDALLGLPFLPQLRRLLVPYNRLASLDGLQVGAPAVSQIRAGRVSGTEAATARRCRVSRARCLRLAVGARSANHSASEARRIDEGDGILVRGASGGSRKHREGTVPDGNGALVTHSAIRAVAPHTVGLWPRAGTAGN